MRDLDAEFETAVTELLELEGGYSSNPADPGGATNFGISQRAYPDVDIAALTADGAKAIYKRDYWDHLTAYNLSQQFLRVAFSCAVNQGLSRCKALLDGSKGLLEYFMADRALAYTALPTFQTFGRGWLRRLFKELE